MKKYIVFYLFILCSGCSPVTVSYDYDKDADFKKFTTYTFTDLANLPLSQLDKERVMAAIDKEMLARGYKKAGSDADLIVDLQAKTEVGQNITTTNYGSGYYGYGYGFGTTSVNVDNYTDGTLFINVIDRGKERVIWQGRGTKTLNENATPEKKEANINNAISAIYTKYPVKPAKK